MFFDGFPRLFRKHVDLEKFVGHVFPVAFRDLSVFLAQFRGFLPVVNYSIVGMFKI